MALQTLLPRYLSDPQLSDEVQVVPVLVFLNTDALCQILPIKMVKAKLSREQLMSQTQLAIAAHAACPNRSEEYVHCKRAVGHDEWVHPALAIIRMVCAFGHRRISMEHLRDMPEGQHQFPLGWSSPADAAILHVP
eukprot:4787142-Amphidinium_carterae.1